MSKFLPTCLGLVSVPEPPTKQPCRLIPARLAYVLGRGPKRCHSSVVALKLAEHALFVPNHTQTSGHPSRFSLHFCIYFPSTFPLGPPPLCISWDPGAFTTASVRPILSAYSAHFTRSHMQVDQTPGSGSPSEASSAGTTSSASEPELVAPPQLPSRTHPTSPIYTDGVWHESDNPPPYPVISPLPPIGMVYGATRPIDWLYAGAIIVAGPLALYRLSPRPLVRINVGAALATAIPGGLGLAGLRSFNRLRGYSENTRELIKYRPEFLLAPGEGYSSLKITGPSDTPASAVAPSSPDSDS